jgi:hypothetical protein
MEISFDKSVSPNQDKIFEVLVQWQSQRKQAAHQQKTSIMVFCLSPSTIYFYSIVFKKIPIEIENFDG